MIGNVTKNIEISAEGIKNIPKQSSILTRWLVVILVLSMIIAILLFTIRPSLKISFVLKRWPSNGTDSIKINLCLFVALIVIFSSVSIIVYLIGMIGIVNERNDWISLFLMLLIGHTIAGYISKQYESLIINSIVFLLTSLNLMISIVKLQDRAESGNKNSITKSRLSQRAESLNVKSESTDTINE
ncbi:hypothetical protein SSS_01618 [Sarcoptes scabiei]|uniref:Uncharacterized protein n=1 Tax=Sarcoptes scabiei TaxID=52283 RepID=A0A834VGU5_SARSC|nr:hypothetical protein SSS_01618 [Sarcoptes scabiei]